MSKPRSIFAGMKLTEQTPLGTGVGPDQRLFTRSAIAPASEAAPAPDEAVQDPPPPPAKPVQPRNLGSKEPTNLPTKEPKTLGSGRGKQASPPASVVQPTGPFDIGIRASHQANFLFTDDELDALDDLKRDAKRRYGLQTTKQDLVRYAVIELLNDYLAQGADSRIIGWLCHRTPKDSR